MHQSVCLNMGISEDSLEEFVFSTAFTGHSFEIENPSPTSAIVNTLIADLEFFQESENVIDTSPSAPVSPEEPPGKLPRHRRRTHISAEKKRRSKIYDHLRELRDHVPVLQSQNQSKQLREGHIIDEAVKYIKYRKKECSGLNDEISKVRGEMERLKVDLEQFQSSLPSSGLPRSSQQPSIGSMYRAHACNKFAGNWHYGIFYHVVAKDLLQTYTEETKTRDAKNYLTSLMRWTTNCLSLTYLRPAVLSGVRYIGTKTNIMSKPENLKQELFVIMQLGTPAATDEAVPSNTADGEPTDGDEDRTRVKHAKPSNTADGEPTDGGEDRTRVKHAKLTIEIPRTSAPAHTYIYVVSSPEQSADESEAVTASTSISGESGATYSAEELPRAESTSSSRRATATATTTQLDMQTHPELV